MQRPADWASLAFTFSWGLNTGLCGASSWKLVYCDLNTSTSFGPECTGPLSHCLLAVLHKNMHKGNYLTCHMVGCWWHKNYLLCCVFNLAVSVIWDLVQGLPVNFFHPNKNQHASWWDRDLISFKTLNAESGTTKRVLEACSVNTNKVTHHWTASVQYAGSEGLSTTQVSSLTKHMTEKLASCYMPEVEKETVKVMAGFSKDEAYFVPETLLPLPYDIHMLEGFLLPNLENWRLQAAAPHIGDSSTCAQNFLYVTLPYFTEVLVQDGIFFIRDFPNHPMARYLKVNNLSGSCLLALNSCLSNYSTM